MTPERLREYSALQTDISVIRSDADIERMLFLSANTYLYLMAEKEMAAFSAWISGVNDTSVQRLDTYFSINLDKTPDGIYIEKENELYLEHYISKGYQCESLPSGAFLLKKTH